MPNLSVWATYFFVLTGGYALITLEGADKAVTIFKTNAMGNVANAHVAVFQQFLGLLYAL